MRDKLPENLFGSADAAFEDRIQRTLKSLERQEEEKHVKKLSFSVVLAVALAIAILGTALAAGKMGIMDFFTEYNTGAADMERLAEMVVSDPESESVQTSLAQFRMRDAIFDGSHLYLTVEITPLHAETLLLGAMVEGADGIVNMGPDFEGMEGTIAEWGASIGRTHEIQTNLFDVEAREGRNDLFSGWGGDIRLETDGTQIYMISAVLANPADTLDFDLICQTMDPKEEKSKEEVRLPLHFASNDTSFNAHSETPVEFTECGVRVDRVTLRGTSMATYYTIEYTVTDGEAYEKMDDGLFFEWIDEKGERLAEGAASGGGVTEVNALHYKQEESTQPFTSVPEKLTLRAFNCWEKTRYEAHEITFVKGE